jgi:hypothetical protein
MWNDVVTKENFLKVLQKVNHRVSIWHSSYISTCISRITDRLCPQEKIKDITHGTTIGSSQKV